MQKPDVASRLFGQALAALIKAKLPQPQLGKADGVAFAAAIKT